MIAIKSVTDSAFKAYGKVVTGINHSEILELLEKMPMPSGVEYVPGIESFEKTKAASEYAEAFYGGMPIQVGMCIGYNQKLNAVEYHRNSEVNIALYDMILLMGKQQDITEDFHYDTSKIEAFCVPAGTAVELYATTLHYAPCNVDSKGFKAIVILPKGTNADLKQRPSLTKEDRLMTAVNKWLIAHEDGGVGGDAFIGLDGENIQVTVRE